MDIANCLCTINQCGRIETSQGDRHFRPNGTGESTAAPQLLQGTLAVSEFVNADVIARGMSAFDPEKVAMPRLIAEVDLQTPERVIAFDLWSQVKAEAGHGT